MFAEYPDDRFTFIFEVLSVRCLCVKLQNGPYASVHQCIGASVYRCLRNHYVEIVQIRSFSGPYNLVFGLNTGKCKSKKNSVFGNFSRSKRRVSLKRVIVLIFRKFISLHFPELLTKEITKIVC